MKKLYSLLSAVAVCAVSASAINPAVVSDFSVAPVKATTDVKAPAKAPVKAPAGEWNAIGEGTWEDGILPRLSGGFLAGEKWTVSVEQSATDANWYRFIPYNDNSSIAQMMGEADDSYMYINVTDPTDVYFEEFTFYDDYTYICCAVGANDGSYNAALYQESRNGKLEDGIITFPVQGIAYLSGQYAYFQMNPSRLALPGHSFAPEWESYGTATMNNAILGPLFAEDENDPNLHGIEVTDVNVLTNIENPNIFRFENVWSFAESSFPLEIDMTDPTHCGVEQQGTGVETDDGYVDLLGFYTLLTKYVAESQLMTTAQYDASEYKDMVIIYDKANEKVTIKPNAIGLMYPDGDSPSSVYTWNEGYAFPSTIEITKGAGISDITVDNSNAPVEYFNLQGIRVENPANGIFIRRQGTNATKVFVK